MKIWLDDVREPPNGTWMWVKNAQDFNDLFVKHHDEITTISFDHDIASYNVLGDEITGYHCLCIVEKFVRYNADYVIPKMYVHSANPVGRSRMQKVINALEGR